MKLLYITNGVSGPGGLERVLSIKASYFADQLGYEVHILTLNDSSREMFYQFSPKIVFHDISCKGNKIQYVLNYLKGVRRVVRQVNPSLISVCDDGLKGFYVPLFLGGKPCPMIYERHVSKIIALGGGEATFIDKMKFLLMNIGAKSYNKFVVLTNDNLSEWTGLKNTVVISNPLSFYPEIHSDLNSKRIIAVGKISYQKGYERLLQAWALIQHRATGWSVHVYGSENDYGYLNKQIKHQGLSNTFFIHPPTVNIEQEYIKSSIYAFPSRFEGFGMVLIEAMACGLPCVSFDCPCGPRDILKDGEDGFLVQNGDIAELANRLLILIKDKDLRTQMGDAGRVNVKRFSIEQIAAKWCNLFDRIIL